MKIALLCGAAALTAAIFYSSSAAQTRHRCERPVPTLFVSGQLDNNTPPFQARRDTAALSYQHSCGRRQCGPRGHGEFVGKLKQQDGKEICVMGGGDLARSLLEAGVIDEIGFNIHPVLLGSGVPLFYEISRSIDLELLECMAMKNGCVYVPYRVKN